MPSADVQSRPLAGHRSRARLGQNQLRQNKVENDRKLDFISDQRRWKLRTDSECGPRDRRRGLIATVLPVPAWISQRQRTPDIQLDQLGNTVHREVAGNSELKAVADYARAFEHRGRKSLRVEEVAAFQDGVPAALTGGDAVHIDCDFDMGLAEICLVQAERTLQFSEVPVNVGDAQVADREIDFAVLWIDSPASCLRKRSRSSHAQQQQSSW